MDVDRIRKYLDLMNEYDLDEMEVEAGEDYFRFSRRTSEETRIVQPMMVPQMMPMGGVSHPAVVPPEAAEGETPSSMEEIRAPMVGTLYRAPSPDSEPFVKEGDQVTPDTVVAIIEAMKVMNEIKAEITGTIRKVLVENSKPVEFGQVMFLVEPG